MHTTHHRSRDAAHFRRSAPVSSSSGTSVLPFDYVARFPINGISGKVQQDVINISSEGTFVALGISYGFEQERGHGIGSFLPSALPPFSPGALTLGQLPIDVLVEGFRVNPNYLPIVFETQFDTEDGVVLTGNFSSNPITADFLNQTPVFERLQSQANLEFLFSMVDTAAGREFQDQPTLNVASLGASDGRRPFLMLPRPIEFPPRSAIRLQIIERTNDVSGNLFIVLFGYKAVGTSACPPTAELVRNSDAATPHPGAKVIPFDYVTRLQLQGRKANRVEDEIAINTEGGYYATGIGYGLQVPDTNVGFNVASSGNIDLNGLALNNFPVSALTDGFRIKPGYMRLAVTDTGTLNSSLPTSLINRIFENLNRPDAVSFRYTILDSGTGRELQNEPIQNIAGLGIANGERPFKKLARPFNLEPRSTVRISVEEHFGRGDLFIVLQGYKILSGSPTAGRTL